MLVVKQINKYKLAKYPYGSFNYPEKSYTYTLLKDGIKISVIISALQVIQGIGCTGPPPVDPTMISENEVREIVERVYRKHNISFAQDVDHDVLTKYSYPITVSLDGYNDSLKIGYEYIYTDYNGWDNYQDDKIEFTIGMQEMISRRNLQNGPMIQVIEGLEEYQERDYERKLEVWTERFIEVLKMRGII